MKVYFIKDAEPHGRKGDIKNVSDGFARNYLIRKGIAVELTESMMRHLEDVRRQKEEKEKRIVAVAEKEAKRMDGKTLEFFIAAREEGKLYGSIRASDIEDRINSKYEPKVPFEVVLENPIKEVGKFEVEVLFAKKAKAKLNIIVTPQNPVSKKT